MSLNTWVLLFKPTITIFILMLPSFTFPVAAVALGITSRCRNSRHGKKSAPLVSPQEWGNHSYMLPVELSSGLTAQIRISCQLLNQILSRKMKALVTKLGLLTKIYFWAGNEVNFLWVLCTLVKKTVQLARKQEGVVVGEAAPPSCTMVFFFNLWHAFRII